MSWQPIASAPKDGRLVLLGCYIEPSGSNYMIGYWNDAEGCWTDLDHATFWGDLFGPGPSHWLEIPEVPKEENEATP